MADTFLKVGGFSNWRAVNLEHVTHVDDQDGHLAFHLINGERVIVRDETDKAEARRILSHRLINK